MTTFSMLPAQKTPGMYTYNMYRVTIFVKQFTSLLMSWMGTSKAWFILPGNAKRIFTSQVCFHSECFTKVKHFNFGAYRIRIRRIYEPGTFVHSVC